MRECSHHELLHRTFRDAELGGNLPMAQPVDFVHEENLLLPRGEVPDGLLQNLQALAVVGAVLRRRGVIGALEIAREMETPLERPPRPYMVRRLVPGRPE